MEVNKTVSDTSRKNFVDIWRKIVFPVADEKISDLKIGERILISGRIYCGRDAVLPRIVELYKKDRLDSEGINLKGSLIFHTAVSRAGVGPTSSNKKEIENSISILSEAGVKMHLGKGALKIDTIRNLDKYESVYAVIPPVTALLESRTKSKRIVAFPELGMEALYELEIDGYPAVIAAAKGESIYD